MTMCNDVKYWSSKINVIGKVQRKELPRMVYTKLGFRKKVCKAFLKYETGEVRLTLWDSDVERIQNGYTIKIRDGFAQEFRGEKYLSSGFYGSIHIISTNPDYNEKPKKLIKDMNIPSSEDEVITIDEQVKDIDYAPLGESAKIERQFWRES